MMSPGDKNRRNGGWKRNETHACGAHYVSHAVVAMATARVRQCYIIFVPITTTAREANSCIVKGTSPHRMCSKCY